MLMSSIDSGKIKQQTETLPTISIGSDGGHHPFGVSIQLWIFTEGADTPLSHGGIV